MVAALKSALYVERCDERRLQNIVVERSEAPRCGVGAASRALLMLRLRSVARRLPSSSAPRLARTCANSCRAFDGRPSARPLPMPRAAVARAGGGMLNACSAAPLAEMLRHLKRAFWPFAWDTSLDPVHLSGGGFRCARAFVSLHMARTGGRRGFATRR